MVGDDWENVGEQGSLEGLIYTEGPGNKVFQEAEIVLFLFYNSVWASSTNNTL